MVHFREIILILGMVVIGNFVCGNVLLKPNFLWPIKMKNITAHIEINPCLSLTSTYLKLLRTGTSLVFFAKVFKFSNFSKKHDNMVTYLNYRLLKKICLIDNANLSIFGLPHASEKT